MPISKRTRTVRAPSLAQAAVAVVLGALLGCHSEEPVEYFDLVSAFHRASILESAAEPRAELASRLLFLPAGSSLSFAFESLRDSTLEVERLALRGSGTRLRLTLSSDTDRDLFEHSIERPGRDLSVELPSSDHEAMSLTLEVESSSVNANDGVLLTRPRLAGLAGELPAATRTSFERSERPDVIIYLVDTLRRDRLGAYGYERPVSPNIDAFAEGATLFERSVGQASWTKASVASMWSGVWPPSHGATGWGHRLPDEFETVAERLHAAGYQTAAFVTNVNASPAFGLAQGFEHVWYEKKQPSKLVSEEVLGWLDSNRDDRPLLLYVHTMDPHAGYRPEEPFRSRFAPTADQMKPWKPRWRWPIENLSYFSDLYDGEIAQNDAAFGALFEALEERDMVDRALIIVLSDHGEEFKEHGGWRHGRVLHHGSLDVPMIVKFPGQQEGSRSRLPVSHVDVLPTVADVVGILETPTLDGQSLAAPVERPVFSHLRLGQAPLQYSVVDGRWKLLQVHGEKARTLLFDLFEDPEETRDLAAEMPVRTALLEGLLRERLALTTTGEAEEIELDDELQKTLRALGYLQ